MSDKGNLEAKIERKLKKLARVLAESNTWIDEKGTKTLKAFSDVWVESYQLIRLMGYMGEFDRRQKQIKRVVGITSKSKRER